MRCDSIRDETARTEAPTHFRSLTCECECAAAVTAQCSTRSMQRPSHESESRVEWSRVAFTAFSRPLLLPYAVAVVVAAANKKVFTFHSTAIQFSDTDSRSHCSCQVSALRDARRVRWALAPHSIQIACSAFEAFADIG